MYFTASSNTPSRSNRPGLEHMENPPITDTPGIKKSTLKIGQKQKLKHGIQYYLKTKTKLLALFQLHVLYKNIFTSRTQLFQKIDLILSNITDLQSSRNIITITILSGF